ncbi:TPA: IS3 family transposase [Salmonella enterica]|nr:IS3 family transposase [Salmonella enterica subsp. enterica]EDT6893041.1 IS3 family transposase [Salmonella enterica subsp. enterica serovar Javiana]EDX5193423.1 IS3 family transposase [Salmonella enterica subsp. enterica serovar Glostrup]EED2931360.1 IS3 family transposase [Salmonella enterica subsp. enterica serovar Javiana]MIY24083.1 hypothetical protein [Salmonella enterica subsp. enterica]
MYYNIISVPLKHYNQLRIKEKLGGLSPVQYRLSQTA